MNVPGRGCQSIIYLRRMHVRVMTFSGPLALRRQELLEAKLELAQIIGKLEKVSVKMWLPTCLLAGFHSIVYLAVLNVSVSRVLEHMCWNGQPVL